MHDLFALGGGIFIVLVGIVYNAQQVRDLRAEMRDLRSDMNGLRAEIHKDNSDLRVEVTRLCSLNTELLFQHAERITRLEASSKS